MTVTSPRTTEPVATASRASWPWPVAGVLAGLAGLALSLLAASALSVRTSPLIAVGDLVIRLTPGNVTESAIQNLGHKDKPLLVGGIVIVLVLLFALAGRLARASKVGPTVIFVALAVVGGIAVGTEATASAVDFLPVIAGLVAWLVTLSLATEPLHQAERYAAIPTELPRDSRGTQEPDRLSAAARASGARQVSPLAERQGSLMEQTRRAFVIRAAIIAVAATAVGGLSRVVGRSRRAVEAARDSLTLDQVTPPVVAPDAQLAIDGITPWATPAAEFYQVHTALVPPSIEPTGWTLRIHGLVDKEISLSYDDLLTRTFTEAWVTLNCVSNPVGGNLVGNAWWSGVRLADILAEAGVQPGADAVLQTSQDGWTCGTPVSALTDDRNAMLAVAMNGQPLPIEHGFPVRTLVPGLYGYVSACKWVVDMEVTTFADIDAYWTERGWGEKGPVKMASRVDVPRSGEQVAAGQVTIAGVAWSQHTGIKAVEYALDGGDWQPATLASEPSVDSWVQWSAQATVPSGDHVVRVRATDAAGLVQTGTVRDVLPNGATGWAGADFSAT